MNGPNIFVIGASAGGVEALTKVIRTLPADFAGSLFLVLHLPPESPSILPQTLRRAGLLPAVHPRDGDRIEPGHIYAAPPDNHLLLEQGYMRVVRGPKENRHRPAIDPLFRSAARAYGTRVVGTLLTGALDDGTAGLMTIKQCGGLAIVQDPEEALYANMPRSALEHVSVNYCLPLDEIGPLFIDLVHEQVRKGEPAMVSETLDKEVQIAEMATNAFSEHEQIGYPSVFSCPDCGGVLWELQESDFLRFRCRTGHAFSAESVLIEQTAEVDRALWNALKTLDEKVTLSNRLARQAQEQGNQQMARQFLKRIQEAEDDARILRHILLNPPLEKQQSEQQKKDEAVQ
jgi:two-component system, chemotaxis family, protein-glutamate methylesterase/glutaminase